MDLMKMPDMDTGQGPDGDPRHRQPWRGDAASSYFVTENDSRLRHYAADRILNDCQVPSDLNVFFSVDNRFSISAIFPPVNFYTSVVTS